MRKYLFPLIVIVLVCYRTALALVTCTISGQIFNIDGTPTANSTITFDPSGISQPLIQGGTPYTTQSTSTTTDANGNLAAIALPQGLIVQITVYQNGAVQGGYRAIVPFMSSVSFANLLQGINTNPLNVLASSQPPTGPLNMNGQKIINTACNSVAGDVEVQGCGTSIGNILITSDLDFSLFSLLEVGGIQLIQQPPVTSIQGVATCTGTCATTYSYEVTCVTSTGETNASAPISLTNASSLTSTNFNTLTWPSTTGASCLQGYNVYGRTAGSLGLMETLPQGTNTFVDNGFVLTPADSWTLNWNKASLGSVVVWDLRGLSTTSPVDQVSTNSSGPPSINLTATSVTTSNTNDTQIPVFSFTNPVAGGVPSWPAFPAGFGSVLQVNGTASVNYGLEGGTKTIAATGSTGTTTVSFSPPLNGAWASINMALSASNPATPATIVGTLTPTVPSPYQTVTFGDPTGTQAGDVLIVCAAYNQGASLVTPSTFNLIGTSTFQTNNSQIKCFWQLPNGTFGKPPPTLNTTGGITQQTASGTTVNLLTPVSFPWTCAAGLVNTATPPCSMTIPESLTVVSCRGSWYANTCSSGFPTYSIVDTTASKTICSMTPTASSTDTALTVLNTGVAANDVLVMQHTESPIKACTAANESMTVGLQAPL